VVETINKALSKRVIGAIATLWLGLSLSSVRASSIVEATLYAFDPQLVATNGTNPVGNLLQGSDGALYGTASSISSGFPGAIFRITPNGQFQSLHAFNYVDGYRPGPMILGQDGAFYGATGGGGTYGPDTVFRITQGGTFSVLYTFADASKYITPTGPLARAQDGTLYGTGSTDYGTVFKISPAGEFSIVYTFGANSNDGVYPQSLIIATDGNLYGVTQKSGANLSGAGTIFRLTTSGVLTTLYHFAGHNSGAAASIIEGNDGNFYGTYDGTNRSLGSEVTGTVFRFTPDGVLSILHRFRTTNSGSPSGILTQGVDGNLYGATGPVTSGGSTSMGSVYLLKLDGTYKKLYSFDGTNNGAAPNGITRASNGKLYGTTFWGGPLNQYGQQAEGVIFRISGY
jgi:uncharacterized repeat protein (TIGR03803 family)